MRRRDYECAIGDAVLALNSLESEVFYLLEILGAAQGMEGVYIKDKIIRVKTVAQQHDDSTIRARLEKIASETDRLADERHNFAHGLLWIDGFTGEHKRTYTQRLRNNKKVSVVNVIDDPRQPKKIECVAFDLRNLALDVSNLAMQLGGLQRWEEEGPTTSG
jgi:hypothetical protein